MKSSEPIRKIDINRVQMATHFSRQHLREWITNAELAWADKERAQREEQQLCRFCWYAHRTRIGGAAMTERGCDNCGCVVLYSSTATDPLCKPCGVKLGICIRCCADIDLIDRRKLERTGPLPKGRR